jgi:bifunctional non-homologous end joining protein LigD
VPGARAPAADQLLLGFDDGGRSRLPARIAPMVPGEGPEPFDDDAWFFEPRWPGEPATLLVEGGRARFAPGQLADPMGAFPELAAIPRQLAGDELALVGTLLVLDAEGRPDRELLRRRLADPSAVGGTGALVVSDLLHADGVSLSGWPFAQRRARLLELLADGERCVVNRGLRGEGRTLAEAAASMGLTSIDARRLSATWRSGPAADAWLRLPVLTPPEEVTRPLLVLLQRLPLEG